MSKFEASPFVMTKKLHEIALPKMGGRNFTEKLDFPFWEDEISP